MKERQHIAHATSNVFRILAECVTVILLCAIGLFLRAQEMEHSIQEKDEIPRIYTQAFVSMDERIPDTVSGTERVYLYLLHGMFRLFGNKERVGVWMQMMLQMSAVVMLYLSVRRVWGFFVPCIGFAAAVLLPPMITESVLPSSGIVLFAGGCLLLVLLTGIVRNPKKLVWFLVLLFTGWAVLGYFAGNFLGTVYFYVILSAFLIIGAGCIRRIRSEYRSLAHTQSDYMSENVVFLDMESDAGQEGKSVKPMDVVNKEPETPAAINYIENPLPVPKRHKRPMMHFDYDVPKGKDNYDVYVADNDDFDI